MSKNRLVLLAIFCCAMAAVSSAVLAQKQQYPQTRKVDHVDTYRGTSVPDPYRWLEDDNSAETAKWVEEQNKVTFAYLNQIPYRAKIKERLETLYNYPKIGAPFRRGELYFFYKNDGLQNQSVLYVQKGLNGTPEVMLDPNKWSPDGTIRLSFIPSKDAKYAVVGVSKSGSDWQEYQVMEVATKKMLTDKVEWVKVSGAAWAGNGFFYSRYPAPEKGHELSTKNENHQVWFHKVGTPQADDELVYEDKANLQRFHNAGTTEDERFIILNISDRGKGKKGNSLFYRDLSKGEKKFTPIVAEIGNDSFGVIDDIQVNGGDKFLLRTDKGAPNGKVVLYDPKDQSWKDVLPERAEPLHSTSTVGGKLFATYMKDVTTRAYVYSLDGKLENEVKLPGPGTASGFGGNNDDKFVFYSFTSMNYPPTTFRYDIATRKSSVYRTVEIPSYKADEYETRQVFFNSKDGTRVPMFLVYRKGLKLDGTNPTLLYGYGGFNITESPSFSALRVALLENGFVYASANLRGGGEYGEKWHEAGTKLKKQNVFDDFIAAAEWLIANKYTSSDKLAMNGGSNGGLLVGAVLNQRPDLFKVAIPQVGVMDMLRFHKFTIGWNWIADYGSSDNPDEFKALRAYSPLHNIRETKYPATLITTADHDDRVVPAHSFKYAATLQEKQRGDAPVLIRIETKSGHGASSTAKQIETTADIYSFLLYNLGVTPKFGSMAKN
jgi:prolyl oligopeptidase